MVKLREMFNLLNVLLFVFCFHAIFHANVCCFQRKSTFVSFVAQNGSLSLLWWFPRDALRQTSTRERSETTSIIWAYMLFCVVNIYIYFLSWKNRFFLKCLKCLFLLFFFYPLMFYSWSVLLSYFPENLNRLKRRSYKIRLLNFEYLEYSLPINWY